MKRITLRDAEFLTVASLLHDAAGLSFDASRRDSLSYSVATRLAATGCTDVATYLALLTSPDAGAERQALLDEVTVLETHFFRNPPQIRALRTHVLPELLRQAMSGKRLRIWSAGCSTGEEPYTVAMLIRELLPTGHDWDVKVLATDISTRALAAAERAQYAERSFVMTDPLDLARWFVLDATSGSFVVRDEVRELVEFRHHNLVTEAPPFDLDEVDLVLCRNVTIYFDRETTRTLMRRLHGRLRDGGYLFLGHSETLWQISDDFTLVPLGDAFVYRRLDDPPPEGGRRAVLPDRRTEDEPMPLRADRRRRHPPERRGDAAVQVRRLRAADAAPPAGRPPRDPLQVARTAIAEGRYAEAVNVAGDAATLTPLSAEAHYLQGVALTNLGQDPQALLALRRAVYLDPDQGFGHFLLAGALARLGEPAAAARSYRAAALTLGRRPADAVAPELGGRTVSELAELCRRLASQADRDARAQGGAA